MPHDPFVLIFRVDDGELEVLEMDTFENRSENAIRIMREVVSLVPEKFEGRTGYVNFFDYPPAFPAGDYDLQFCSTRWQEGPSRFLPFPSSNSPGWPHVGIPDGYALTEDLLSWQSLPCDGRILWIGANTHPSRVRLAELAARHPQAIDAELMEWNRNTGNVRMPSKTRYVSMWDHRHAKYLIDCPGTGYSGRLRWLLATGRPVFIVDRAAIEHWHARMIPWVHFIPIRPDLSDLMWAYKRLESDPALYGMISENARQFVRNHLLHGREVAHIASQMPEPTQCALPRS
ncbi:MAG: glycosyl transferase family 90 [Verrucomicrobiota bacterium]